MAQCQLQWQHKYCSYQNRHLCYTWLNWWWSVCVTILWHLLLQKQQQWLTAKTRQLLQRNPVSWQTNCRQQHQLEHCHSMVTNQETVQGQLNRYISDLTETNLDTENAIKFWSERMSIYKLIGPLALDLLSAPASQAFVERIFSFCSVVWWLQGEEIGWKHPFRCVHF